MAISNSTILGIKTVTSGKLLSTDLFSRLRQDILIGKYKRGYKLTEQNICTEYKVSRTPVREALRQLEMEGLIETIPNRGAFVLGFSVQDVKDIFELRKSYEIQAVKWAIERITDDELDALEETFEFMEFYTQKNDIEKMLKINVSFHQVIYEASHNRMLRNILASYQQYTEHVKNRIPHADNYLPELLKEHREIFNAFKSKDVESGMEAMGRHMDKSIERGSFYF
jgi:DNA-binding GntR family transcriptional regulator